MQNPSLKTIAYRYVKSKYPSVVHGGELERMALNEWGYKASNVSRRMRELENDGYVERVMLEKNCIGYRWKLKETPKLTEEEKLKLYFG